MATYQYYTSVFDDRTRHAIYGDDSSNFVSFMHCHVEPSWFNGCHFHKLDLTTLQSTLVTDFYDKHGFGDFEITVDNTNGKFYTMKVGDVSSGRQWMSRQYNVAD